MNYPLKVSPTCFDECNNNEHVNDNDKQWTYMPLFLTLIIRYCNHMLIQDFFQEKGVNFCLENTDFFFYSETTIGQDFYLEK